MQSQTKRIGKCCDQSADRVSKNQKSCNICSMRYRDSMYHCYKILKVITPLQMFYFNDDDD